jgi:flagellar biosynthesis protein FlhF
MKIKRYTATTMREALSLIRAEQGEEAVILSTRRLEDGVEVVSAVDYDAALMGDATRHVSMPPPPASDAAPRRREAQPAAPRQPAGPQPEAPQSPALQPPAPEYSELQRELKDMRQFLEGELAALGWNNQRQQNPFNTRVLEELTALDIAPDITRALVSRLPKRTSAKNPAHIPLALLVKHLPMLHDPTCIDGGVVAVVGPTGVGKTTTIAKLAARWCMRHGNQELALVSTDGYRIGARDQLLTYARILDVPMYVADDGPHLAQILTRLRHKRLVLVDTAGLGQRDKRVPEQLDSLRQGLGDARVLLALPSAGESKAVDEIVRVYGRIAPDACILTKIDEAASLGAALSAVLRRELPIAYLCDGQRVPEDLHDAEDKRLWLIRTALDLKNRARSFKDEGFLARNFGRVHTHA